MSEPLMLRVYAGTRVGSTAFFRNRVFLKQICGLLAGLKRTPKVLFHACSIGAEPYSFIAAASEAGLAVKVDATDIEPEFLEIARAGIYAASITDGLLPNERRWFRDIGSDRIQIADVLRDQVSFLEPMPVTAALHSRYDAVFAMNVLTYVTPDEQRRAIAAMGAAAQEFLCLTAFHPDSIEADVSAVSFAPVIEDQEAIHDGWVERRKPVTAEPGTPEYSWVLPPYDKTVPDHEWRFCSIFRHT